MTNFVLREVYTPAAAGAADAVHIDGYSSLQPGCPDIPVPDIPVDDLWTVFIQDIVDAIDASSGIFQQWGKGLTAWDGAPDDDVSGETDLTTPLGIFPGAWSYVEPDPAGAIIMGDGSRWTLSVDPTPYILTESAYAAEDESGNSIRELALRIGSEIEPGHEADAYWPMANVSAPGALQAMDRIKLAPRSPETSGKVRFLLTVEA